MEQSPATEPEIVSILVYEAPGYRNIRTRTRYMDGEQTDASASYEQRGAFQAAKRADSSLQMLDVTGRDLSEYSLEARYGSFSRVDTGVQPSNPPPRNTFRLEDQSGDEDETTTNQNCEEVRDPDGSYRRSCSMSWSFSSTTED